MDNKLDLPDIRLFCPSLSNNLEQHINNDKQRVLSISNQCSDGEKSSDGESAKPSHFQASILK